MEKGMTLAAPRHLLTGNDLRLTPIPDPVPYGARMTDVEVRPVAQPTTYDFADDRDEFDAALRWAHRVIDPFRDLPPNWDSYGGSPIDNDAAEYAGRLLAAIVVARVRPPQAAPTSDGGVSFEWHRQDVDFVITISPDEPSTASFRSGPHAWEIDDFTDPRFSDALSALSLG
jgi:hypothetical protein